MRLQERLPPLTLRAFLVAAIFATGLFAWAQGRHMRRHTATKRQALALVPADQHLLEAGKHSFTQHDGHRHVIANGIPTHEVGQFPNRRNPNGIRAQHYSFSLPANPKPAEAVTPLHQSHRFGPPNLPFGIAVNGVLFDPGTAEYWNGDRNADWNYEALGGAVPLGVDENHAHVQPNGAYHYHGLPTMLLKELGHSATKHSPLVGWAADGFPIYCQYGYRDPHDPNSPIVELRSSFGVKDGNRPNGPGGMHDGTFIQDYQYDEGIGDLDECNGRFCTTPEFPEGTYAYFLTSEWPVIPRAFRAKPVNLR